MARRNDGGVAPTPAQFGAYQGLFDYFNERLFSGSLPGLILNFSRRARSYGFFAPERWTAKGRSNAHEISLNPEHISVRAAEEVASTLVHEMVHLWQHENGTPSRTGYHNREWAAKMLEVGLIPSDTGQPGGKQTGQHMTHYIDPKGAFLRAWKAMSADLWLPWGSVPEGSRKKAPAPSKFAYFCPEGHGKVWGKPGLALVCGECDRPYEADALPEPDLTRESSAAHSPAAINTPASVSNFAKPGGQGDHDAA